MIILCSYNFLNNITHSIPSINGVSGQSFSGNRCRITPLLIPLPRIIYIFRNVNVMNICTYVLFHDHTPQPQNNLLAETYFSPRNYCISFYYIFGYQLHVNSFTSLNSKKKYSSILTSYFY